MAKEQPKNIKRNGKKRLNESMQIFKRPQVKSPSGLIAFWNHFYINIRNCSWHLGTANKSCSNEIL